MLGAPPARPHNLGTANWLPFGWQSTGVLIYRQLLPATFAQAIQRAPSSLSAMRARMGAYYPTITQCSTAQWSANRCGSLSRPLCRPVSWRLALDRALVAIDRDDAPTRFCRETLRPCARRAVPAS